MPTLYDHWLEANRNDMRDMWESMGIVERFEEGPEFSDFCKNQYDNGYAS